MPMHDWTRVGVGVYHDFLQGWAIDIRRVLNAGLLPPGYHAVVEYRKNDVKRDYDPREPEATAYARRANRILIQTDDERAVALIAIVSPGNKAGAKSVQLFVSQAVEYLTRGVSLLVVDPFPPTRDDSLGLPQVILDKLNGKPLEAKQFDKTLTASSFVAEIPPTAYIDQFAVGDPVPEMPLFLEPGRYVNVPLEASYQASWNVLPEITRKRVLSPPGA